MLRRLAIGLRYKHQDDWVGGVYYVQNLVRAFGLLPERKRPRLVIVGGDKPALEELKAATGYPDLHRLSRARLHREPAPPRLAWLFDGPLARPRGEEIHVLLMGSPPGLEDRGAQWVPDFQEHRFPEFFPAEELKARYSRNAQWFAGHRHVIVSSQDVAGDLARYYGEFNNRVHVVRFASFIPDVQDTDARRLKSAYGLPERYFICNNQLWRHKNHAVILRALAEPGPRGEKPFVVFTGKEEDYRDPGHAPSLRRMAVDLGVDGQVRFLGFLPREDQLGLMRGAVAVIQPSLCEGWSTVIEDAKALGRHVLASDIAVHGEQLDRNADFFAPHDHQGLAALLHRYARTDPEALPFDYARARMRFAEDLWRMTHEIEQDLRRRRVFRLAIRT
jgi:glycosyltransferase involved in cell wall biosynthesis